MCCACGGGTPVCVDTDNGLLDASGYSCADYTANFGNAGYECTNSHTSTFDADVHCCACGGGVTSTSLFSPSKTELYR